MNYAIVDIETTGGHAAQHSIIEIAIVVTDGKQILKRYETLVDPGMDIPRHINGLTGIDDGMVAAAPMFDKIADEVYELLKDCVFVAHSVNFDLSFVKAELAACGYKFNPPKLCTVRLGRKLLPGHRSYSLGSLCSNLGIEIENRHRAMGDAEATFQVFKLLMEADTDYTMATAMKRTTGEHKLPPNLSQDQFKALPEKAGVYYFYNGQGKIIYIGKAVNIKKRVSSHFTANLKSARRQQFMREIHSISHEETGNELIALLLESHEIQKHWPIYNKALKRIEFHYGVFDFIGNDGYLRLAVDRVRKGCRPLAKYDQLDEALQSMLAFAETHQFCMNKCLIAGKEKAGSPCSTDCSCKQGKHRHNALVEHYIASLNENKESFLMLSPGRNPQEKALVLVQDGAYKGFGFADSVAQSDTLMDYIKPFPHTRLFGNVIGSFIGKKGYEVRKLG